MTEVTRAEYELTQRAVRENTRRIARLEMRFAVINTKLTAILWLVAAVGTAVIAAIVKTAFGVGA